MTRPESVPNPDPAPDPALDPGANVPVAASRRAFMAGAGAVTVAGAAAVAAASSGAGVLASAAAAGATVTTATDAGDAGSTASSGPAVVAYVRDLASGEVRVMSGEREVVVRDRGLASTLARHLDGKEA